MWSVALVQCTTEPYRIIESFTLIARIVESAYMTYEVILRKKQNKYSARVRDWPEVVVEEETREAALTQIKQYLAAYLSRAPEVIPIICGPDIGSIKSYIPTREFSTQDGLE
jgi:predicted RNase H-like HicB family nuclease